MPRSFTVYAQCLRTRRSWRTIRNACGFRRGAHLKGNDSNLALSRRSQTRPHQGSDRRGDALDNERSQAQLALVC